MFASGVEFVRLSATFHFRGCACVALSKGAGSALSNHRTFLPTMLLYT